MVFKQIVKFSLLFVYSIRDELERRELLHSVQLLRLEVSQKQLVIEALKTERATELEEMKEQLADAQHENKLLKLRLQSLTHAYEKEMENVRKTRVEPPLQVAAALVKIIIMRCLSFFLSLYSKCC